MTETVLVTGGTGFIARWCIVELLQRGYGVRTTVRDPPKESTVRTPGRRLMWSSTARTTSSRNG